MCVFMIVWERVNPVVTNPDTHPSLHTSLLSSWANRYQETVCVYIQVLCMRAYLCVLNWLNDWWLKYNTQRQKDLVYVFQANWLNSQNVCTNMISWDDVWITPHFWGHLVCQTHFTHFQLFMCHLTHTLFMSCRHAGKDKVGDFCHVAFVVLVTWPMSQFG